MSDPKLKERPILMSGPMVRAYYEGRKTETRRPVKPEHKRCPWGGAGDKVWVRETFALMPGYDSKPPSYAVWHANVTGPTVFYRADGEDQPGRGRWRASIHMPRVFCSRITVTLLETRRERLLDITEAGARAEGFDTRADFLIYWDLLHGKGAAAKNKEVWGLRWAPYGGE
jgi:hypothetical protein